MLQQVSRRLTYANVVSTLGLFLVLTGGTAMAVNGSLPGQNTVGSKDIINNEVTGADVNESTLGKVPSALTATLGGRGGPTQDTCNPNSAAFETCATVGLTVPPGPEARALVFGHVRAFAEGFSSEGLGRCRLSTNTLGPISDTDVSVGAPAGSPKFFNLVGVVPLLGPGAHTLRIECNDNDSDFNIDYDRASVQVIGLAAG